MSSLKEYCRGIQRCIRFAANWANLNTQQRLTALRYYKRVCTLEEELVAQRWHHLRGVKDALDRVFNILIEDHSDDVINALCLSKPRPAQGPRRHDEPEAKAQA